MRKKLITLLALLAFVDPVVAQDTPPADPAPEQAQGAVQEPAQDAPEVEPAPQSPPEPSLAQQAVTAFQSVITAVSNHDRGATDVSDAQINLENARTMLADAEARAAAVATDRQSSAQEIVTRARAAITVLEQLVASYSPAGP